MKLLAFGCVLVGLSLQDLVAVSRGHRCEGQEPSIRYFCEYDHFACYPFLYEGCGGDDNNYEDSYSCLMRLDHFDCGYGRRPERACYVFSKHGIITCNETTQVCTPGEFGGCCDKEYLERVDKPYTCPDGGKIVLNEKGYTLVSSSCDHKFCPQNSQCVKGEFVAWCCQQ